MLINIVLCILGFLLLYYGAEWLVKGSSSLAESLGITPIVIGLTIVAFGTSAPELFVSVVSSIKAKGMIAVGNVIGSNIFNITLVLGTAAVFHPLPIHPSVVKRDIPIMIGISLFLFFLTYNSILGRLEGLTLFAGIIVYIFFNYFYATQQVRIIGIKQHKIDSDEAFLTSDPTRINLTKPKQFFLILAGISGVILGADLVVDSAVIIMKVLGVSEKFIGLTIVAFGTSLPELATSVVAAYRKEMDISIGNLIGSNVFNILSVLGAAAIVKPIHIPGGFFESGLYIDYLVMLATSFLPWILMQKNYTLNRKSGIFLLICYAGYLSYLIIKT